MGRRTDLHGFHGDVDARQLLELMVHGGELAPDVFGRVGDVLLDPCDVQEHSTVRATPAFFDLADDTTCHVIPGQQFRRTAGVPVTGHVAPAFIRIVRGLVYVEVRDVVEHEAAALGVLQDAALAPNAFSNEQSAHAGRPHHARGVELNELHVDEFGAGVIAE